MLQNKLEFQPSHLDHNRQLQYNSPNFKTSVIVFQGDNDDVQCLSDDELLKENNLKFNKEKQVLRQLPNHSNQQQTPGSYLQNLNTNMCQQQKFVQDSNFSQNSAETIKENYSNEKQPQQIENIPQFSLQNEQSRDQISVKHSVCSNTTNSNANKIKTFESAYIQLGTQICQQGSEADSNKINAQQLLISEKDQQEFKKKKIVQSPEYQQSLFERLNHDAVKKQEYQKNLKEFINQEQMKECTFTPTMIQNQKDSHSYQSVNPINNQSHPEYNTERRTLNQFIEDQEKFKKNLQEKKLMLKYQDEKMREEEMTGRPQINNNKQLKNRDNTKPVYERLYNLNKKKQEQQELKTAYQQSLETEESTFRPVINEKSKFIQRQGNVTDHLYEDAQNRKEKMQCLKQEHLFLEKQKHSVTKYTSNKTDQIVASKFIKEYESILNEFVGDNPEPAIDYIKLAEIFKRLGFLHQDQDNDIENPLIGQERGLIYDAWVILKGEEYGGVTRRNFCQLFLSLIGCGSLFLMNEQTQNDQNTEPNIEMGGLHYKDGNQFQGENGHQYQYQQNNEFQEKLKQLRNQNSQNQQLGFFNQNGQWIITVEDSRTIQKHFDLLYRNRLSNEELKKSSQQETQSFHPQINKKSRQLANQYREKILEETANLIESKQINANVPENGKITHVELLIYQQQAQQIFKEQKIQNEQQEKLKDCTFKPKINENSQNYESIKKSQKQLANSKQNLQQQTEQSFQVSIMSSNNNGIQKSMELYSMAKPRTQRTDKAANQIEYERQCDECTFKPDLISQKQSQSQTKLETKVKYTDKTVERMRLAREQREQKNLMLERGYNFANSSTLSVNSNFSCNKSQQQPVTKKQKPQQQQQQKESNFNKNKEKDQTSQQENNNNQLKANFNLANNEKNLIQNDIQQQDNKGDDMSNNTSDRIPLLFVDVNLGQEQTERIVVYEGDTSEELSIKFAEQNGLDENMRVKLQALLESQIASLLTRIEEEITSTCEDQ